VPLLVRWPGAVRPGTTEHGPVISMDLHDTILHAAGLKRPAPGDGLSLVGLLRQEAAIKERALFWHYPHYHPGGATPYSAVRAGDWRLVEFFEDNRVELYNLKDDISEQHDLATSNLQVRDKLLTQLHSWRKQVGAQLPTPNPDFDAAKDKPAVKAKAK